MDARSYYEKHKPKSDSVMNLFKEQIIALMEGFAAMEAARVPKSVTNSPSTDYDKPVIGHFRDESEESNDDYSSTIRHFGQD